MLLKMSDGETKYDADTEAAIIWAGLEVADLTYLFDSGRGYMRPGDTGPYLRGTMGWSFMSWILLNWLDAGLIEVYADSDLEPDDELRRFGWLDRAISDRRWLNLQPEDARTLLSDNSLWDDVHVASQMQVGPSELGKTSDQWVTVARESRTLPPPLGEDPRQRALRERQNAHTDWESLSVKWEFPANGATDDNPGRIVARPTLYVVRLVSASGETWARVLADSEEQIRMVRNDVDVWTEKDALSESAIANQVQQLRKSVPASIDHGLPLRKLI